jgi:acyl-CoA synthetase (AMP-forming)/AMP-acid ligase II
VKLGSLGRVVDGYQLRVLPEEARGADATPVPVGEIGVLWVRGDSVAQGYFQDRDKSWRPSTATGAAPAICSASTPTATCTSRGAPTIC